MQKKIEPNIERLRDLSRKIDVLFNIGNTVEAEELLRKAIEESADEKAYHLFFKGEIAGYLEKNHTRQEEYFREANEIRQDDFFLLRNRGVCASHLGRNDDAIVWFEKALKENPKDSNSMRNMGAVLSELDRGDDAIK